MIELLQKYGPLLWENTYITLLMVAAATLFAYVFGLPMGVLLKVTDRGGIMENRAFNSAFGWIVNILRSLPFVILMVALIPLTRLIVGKAIGPRLPACPSSSRRRPSWRGSWKARSPRSTTASSRPPSAWAPPTGRSSPAS